MPFLFVAYWRLGVEKQLKMSLEEEDETRYFHIMEGVGINSETMICQYLDLEYLMKILNEESYYVKRKKFFVDDREKDFPELLRFGLEPMDPEYRKDHAAAIAKRQVEWAKSVSQYKKQSYLLTSCWTVRTMENILMWDRGDKSRACIVSTIGDFVGSFEKDINYEIWCGRMFYEPFSKVIKFENKIWVKEPYYADENEIRFYFSSSFEKVEPDITKDGECPEKGVSLKVTPKQMMREIVLSPYLDKECAESLRKAITDKYQINARPSLLDLSNKE